LVPAGSRLVVVAPHPDDETVSAGGLIHDVIRLDREVLIVGVTPGDASHPGSSLWPRGELIAQRRAERLAALKELGQPTANVREMGIADGHVAAAADELTDLLTSLLGIRDVVVSPWRFDGHPDHESAAECAQQACRASGASSLQAPIWGWHWAEPDSDLIPSTAPKLLPLGERASAAKRHAIKCFTSQLTPDPSTGADPILAGWAIARLSRDTEVFL
jgi:LmbE family N-acetylglucosaminyl deacetylase